MAVSVESDKLLTIQTDRDKSRETLVNPLYHHVWLTNPVSMKKKTRGRPIISGFCLFRFSNQ